MMKRKSIQDITEIPTKIVKKDAFSKLYATALYDMSFRRSFHDDGGCYHEMMQTYVTKEDDWAYIYQPSTEMKKYENGLIFLIFKRAEPISKDEFKRFQSVAKKINRVYLQSYNDVLKRTGGKWSTPIVTGSFNEIAQIEKSLYLDEKGVMKMSMTIRGFNEGTCNDVWDPVRLKCMIEGIDISDDTLDENILENYNNYRSDAVPAK
jgi:hypothetical protein